MTHSTIMQRLILLTAVPVIALIMSSGTLIWDSFGRYQSAGQAHSIMEVAVAAGDLIHPMQIERGMTAGYISSSGQKFADTLPEIRIVTDEKHAAFRRLLKGFDTGGMPNLKRWSMRRCTSLTDWLGHVTRSTSTVLRLARQPVFTRAPLPAFWK